MITLLIIAAIALVFASYQTGRRHGVEEGQQLGEDIGWLDCELDHLQRDAARDRARRNRMGQFKPRKPGKLDLTCHE